jgi:hypothetical protein
MRIESASSSGYQTVHRPRNGGADPEPIQVFSCCAISTLAAVGGVLLWITADKIY